VIFVILMIRPHPRSTLFPYTTLFRSLLFNKSEEWYKKIADARVLNDAILYYINALKKSEKYEQAFKVLDDYHFSLMHLYNTRWRSEEHTSELQSQSNLVCRLLLEKKK